MANKELYNKLLEKGCLKVWLTEMEFLASDQMEYRKNLWTDTLSIDDMTVFAVDGYGDLYAWRPDDSVVIIETGPGECKEFAGSLIDAIFRRIIEFVNGDYCEMCSNEEKADMDPDDAEYCTSENDAIELLKQYINVFGEFFSVEQKDYIEKLIVNGFLPDCNAFIYEDEMLRVIHDWLRVKITAPKKIFK